MQFWYISKLLQLFFARWHSIGLEINLHNFQLKRFLVVQNISKVLRIGFISFNLSSLDKGCCRFKHFRLALFKNHR